ncbi:flavodoxin [Kosmotoga arenicorallina S304]|uniref:Flavodoxin n=1 Tax=Kosmotoga arenicorallina S304 TaxID=1453497 RepID=A0A176JZC5_9BACT|nr:flavodoxin domain-containing protein [Kosmotoga arenicorallina]OAA29431.1 flavodoxin [Kosmotoga arenicorallina S304]
MKTLIIYTSKTGTTEKCAKKLAENLKSETQLMSLKNAAKEDIKGYDAVIIGSYIHASHVPGKLKRFIKKHPELLQKKLGLFLCMADVEEKFDEYLTLNFPGEFLNHCSVKGYFGGEFNFEKMNLVTRKIIQKMAEGKEMPSLKEENIVKFAKEFEEE